MPMSTERFLVTGAAGCIGAWAVRLLLDEGVPVVATDLSGDLRRFELISQGRGGGRPEFAELDVTSGPDVAALVADRGITHVDPPGRPAAPVLRRGPAARGRGQRGRHRQRIRGHPGRRPGPSGLAFASSAAVYGNPAAHPAGLVADNSPLVPDSFYGVYKAANEGTAKVYAAQHGIGSVGLRPFIVYGLGRDQGMTSDPTKAMLAAAAGVPFRIKFSGSMLLTYAPDCARAFIASARAAAGSAEAISLNVPGQRIGVPALAGLIDEILPGTGRLITWDDNPIPVPSLLAPPAIHDAVGDVPNIALADGVRETIKGFQDALAAGLVSPAQP